jgi:hypothetical protein
MELTPEQAMALIEIRGLLRSRGIDVDAMTDEEVVGFVNRAIQWIADLVQTHEPVFNTILRLAQQQKTQPPNAESTSDNTEV